MPIAGNLIDRKGYQIQVLYISGTLNLIGHLINIFMPDCAADDGDCLQAIVPFILYGINYTLNVVVAYGAIPYVIDDANKLGTAYGVFTCLSNLGNAVISYVAAYI